VVPPERRVISLKLQPSKLLEAAARFAADAFWTFLAYTWINSKKSEE
jgi:hypothetical protein